MMRASAILVALLALSACTDETATAPGSDDGSCGAEALQNLVGQPESAFDPASVNVPVRVIHPGDAVTMDYAPDRLNVEIGDDGLIAVIRCG